MADDSTLPSPDDVLAGKYRIERLIGRGGMGAVFAAQHILLNQRVAVKLLLGELASSPEATSRFMNEARAAAQIRGDHVARVLDIGQLATGMPYMVLEYLEGADFASLLLARGHLSVPEVADYALQALDALAQAHAAGIVHRDLKPANLFLAKRHDGTSVVKVLDFGISKNLAALGGTPQGMTQTRAILGSPQYMSPEQLRTPRGVDTRTDIWSMGVILYEFLTGHMPFKGEAIGELFLQIMDSTPSPVRSHRVEVPAALDAVVMRCLSRDPDARFANVNELAAALRVFAPDPMRALTAARGSSADHASAGPMVAGGQPMVGTRNTASPWANTGPGSGERAGLPSGQRAKVVGVFATSAIVVIVVFVGGLALMKRGTTADGSSTAGVPSLVVGNDPNTTAAITLTATAAVAAALHDAAAVAPPKPQASTVAAGQSARLGATPVSKPVVALPAHAPTPALPVAGSPVSIPVAPVANNCKPDYYFDKDGQKHFKPECF
jgi:hypothetical protein